MSVEMLIMPPCLYLLIRWWKNAPTKISQTPQKTADGTGGLAINAPAKRAIPVA